MGLLYDIHKGKELPMPELNLEPSEPVTDPRIEILLSPFKDSLPLGVIEELEFRNLLKEGLKRMDKEIPSINVNQAFNEAMSIK